MSSSWDTEAKQLIALFRAYKAAERKMMRAGYRPAAARLTPETDRVWQRAKKEFEAAKQALQRHVDRINRKGRGRR